MIRRTAERALRRLAEEFSVVAITGPRQSGKSTLAQMTFPDKRYVSLDDRDLRELAASNPKDFLNAFPDGVIIEASYIIHFLEPDTNNLGKTILKTPKLYFVDSGLLCYTVARRSSRTRIRPPVFTEPDFFFKMIRKMYHIQLYYSEII